jgi:hypothetical protein
VNRPVAVVAVAIPLLWCWSGALRAQEPSTVKEHVEVREIPVLVQMPPDLSGKPLGDVARRVVVLEDGAERTITALETVARPQGPGFGEVEVVFDRSHCDADVLARASAALGDAAAELAALGPVRVSSWGPRGYQPSGGRGSTSPERISEEVAAAARQGCPPPASAAPAELTPVASCSATPCLLLWVSAGWGTGPDLEAEIGKAGAAAREMATAGWTVAGFAPVLVPPAERKTVPPETRPGDDRATWTVDVLHPRGDRARTKPESAYRSDAELSLAPLRRMAEVTAGSLTSTAEGLAQALRSLGARTLLYYRTDRAPSERPATFEVRRTDGEPGEVVAPRWAPAARR